MTRSSGCGNSMISYISYVSSAAVIPQTSHVIMRSSLCGFYTAAWRRSICNAGVKEFKLDFLLARFGVRCYSARRARASRLPKVKVKQPMEDKREAFYIVRKGDIIGIYKNFSDCQAQVSFSVCDPPVSVYKAYSLPKETEELLASRGLSSALYTIHAADLKDDHFGTLVPCTSHQPEEHTSSVDKASETTSQKRSMKVATMEAVGSSVLATKLSEKRLKLDSSIEAQPLSYKYMVCILEFDGASKGNPGKAGAGAILRTEDGSVVCRVQQGLGVVSNNVAEYRALILGMQHALKKGFKDIRVQGDSKLVCMQVQGLWQTKNQNMADLCKVVKKLKDQFVSFQINHVKREFNSDADGEANLAVDLPDGVVFENGQSC